MLLGLARYLLMITIIHINITKFSYKYINTLNIISSNTDL